MTNLRKWRQTSGKLGFLILILLVLGIFFRFFNLQHKVYWHDEVYTSIRSSGYTGEEVVEKIFDGRVIGIKDLQKYQHLSPQKGLKDTIGSLRQHPEHPPLYYLILRFWRQNIGSSISVTRSLSAVISLLSFPSIYWLCLELFESSTVGWTAVSLIAVSPFHVLYAQEAREYSLWTVTILLSSASLLRAVRYSKRRDAKLNFFVWATYAITLALSFYTFLFSIFVAISHGIYVFFSESCRITRIVFAYILAAVTVIILFTPWLLIIINNFLQLQDKTSWTTTEVSASFLWKIWGLHLSCLFIDLGLDISHPFTYVVPPLLLILVGYAVYFLCCHTTKYVWLFVVTLILVTPLSLMLPDLIWGGQRSVSSRYFLPCYLGIQLAIAYLLANKISSYSFPLFTLLHWRSRKFFWKTEPIVDDHSTNKAFGNHLSKQNFWQGTIVVIIIAGVVSCSISSQANTWWNKGVSYQNPQVARIINQAHKPLLISTSSNEYSGVLPGNLISLSYLLEPKVKLQLVVDPNIPDIPDGFSDIFVYSPSRNLEQGLKERYKTKINTIYEAGIIKLGKLENYESPYSKKS
ncbi:glycosyltransferase family 39 protein [Lyngbya aestuarii]|uniref:glycosyltransferase family 39 protein n=1 Tax=Lyngbya aestuarii TaxID=118322 RepID=UPI00403DCE0A